MAKNKNTCACGAGIRPDRTECAGCEQHAADQNSSRTSTSRVTVRITNTVSGNATVDEQVGINWPRSR